MPLINMEKRGLLNNKNHPSITHKRTLGEISADILTKYMGSWMFILIFLFFLLSWISLNSIWLIFGEAWDKKPFIMLNLILSCLAALQAPIILMTQNRQSEKDRIRSEYDYAVNRKAEHEIKQVKRQLDKIERKLR